MRKRQAKKLFKRLVAEAAERVERSFDLSEQVQKDADAWDDYTVDWWESA